MTTNPLQMRLAAMWDTAMGDGNGMAAAAAALPDVVATRPGWVQDTALDLLLTHGGLPGVAWISVASNTLGAMLREARTNREDETDE